LLGLEWIFIKLLSSVASLYYLFHTIITVK
jgi:hypothetical protein